MKVEKKGKTAEIVLEKDLTDEYSTKFISDMNELVKDDIKRFNLDFSGLLMIDSASLSYLIILCEKSDLEFSFKNLSKPLITVFEITKLNRLVLFE
jgi:anti-anti-sigma regulatory factor